MKLRDEGQRKLLLEITEQVAVKGEAGAKMLLALISDIKAAGIEGADGEQPRKAQKARSSGGEG